MVGSERGDKCIFKIGLIDHSGIKQNFVFYKYLLSIKYGIKQFFNLFIYLFKNTQW